MDDETNNLVGKTGYKHGQRCGQTIGQVGCGDSVGLFADPYTKSGSPRSGT